MKKCTKCKVDKPLDDFYKDFRAKDGLRSLCKTCHNKETTDWGKKNSEKKNSWHKRWRDNNIEKVKEYEKKYREENTEKRKAVRQKYYEREKLLIKKRYMNNPKKRKEREWKSKGINLTMEEYNRLFSEQEGCCAICGTHQSNLPRRLSVDHCHDTGVIRGLLCTHCNLALGIFGDDIGILLNAINYLHSKVNGEANNTN